MAFYNGRLILPPWRGGSSLHRLLLSRGIAMAKKKASRKKGLAPGTPVRVRPGITAPEFPDVVCEGWTGVVRDTIGKKSDPQYVVEWDDGTIDAMPDGYQEQCEEKNLLFSMSCFTEAQLEPIAES